MTFDKEELHALNDVLRTLKSSKPIGFIVAGEPTTIHWVSDALMEDIRELLIADLKMDITHLQFKKGIRPNTHFKNGIRPGTYFNEQK